MDNTITTNNKLLKCGAAIKILSVISLICSVLTIFSNFFYYHYDYTNAEYVFRFYFPPMGILIRSLLLGMTPVIIIFVLYIFKFYSKLKATVLVPIIFGILGISHTIFNGLFDGAAPSIYIIFLLILLGSSILAVISALKGFNKKASIIIFISVYLLYVMFSLIRTLPDIRYCLDCPLYLVVLALSYIRTISFYVALLLFGLKNKIPCVISPKKEKQMAEELDPEQALKLLKDKVDFGMITEEEYRVQRAEIINKL